MRHPEPFPLARRAAGTLAALAAALLAGPPLYALHSHYMTQEFRARVARPVRVAVLPPIAGFLKQQAVMSLEMTAETAAIEAAAGEALAAEMRTKGYEVLALSAEEARREPELAKLVADVNKRYDEEWPKILDLPQKVNKGRYGIGDRGRRLAEVLGVDGLVFTRIVAVCPTMGSQAMTFILSRGSQLDQSYARMGVAIVEAKGGRVEGYFTGYKSVRLKSMMEAPAKAMAHLARATVDDCPGASEMLNLDDEVVAGAPEAEDRPKEKDQEATIRDFEALLTSRATPEATPPSAAAEPASPQPSPAAEPEGSTAPAPQGSPSPAP